VKKTFLEAAADPGFAKREGADHGERAEREPITGVWDGAPNVMGSRGRVVSGKPFVHFYTKMGQKLRI